MKYFWGLIATLSALYGANEGMKVYGKGCVDCHGDDGKDISISAKPIAGSSGVYEKLIGYKNGTYGGEQKATMQEALKPLNAESLKAVSDYVEKLK